MKLLLLILALAWAGLLICVPARPGNAATTTEKALTALCPGKEHLAPHVDAAARRYLLPRVLLVAVMRVESHCRMEAVGAAKERCAFQVRGVARNGRSDVELADPATCIDTGARWLSLMVTWAGGLGEGIGAYNTGKLGNGRGKYARKVLAMVARACRAIERKG